MLQRVLQGVLLRVCGAFNFGTGQGACVVQGVAQGAVQGVVLLCDEE